MHLVSRHVWLNPQQILWCLLDEGEQVLVSLVAATVSVAAVVFVASMHPADFVDIAGEWSLLTAPLGPVARWNHMGTCYLCQT